MELDQGLGEAFNKSVCSRDMASTQMALEYVSLFAKGISLILYRWYKLQVVAAHTRVVYNEIAEYLRINRGKINHPRVDKMVADIVDFLIRLIPQKEPRDVESLCNLLYELVHIYFKFGGVLQGIGEVGEKMYNLYQEILQGKYDSVEELGKTTSWIGEEFMEKLKSVEEEELINVRAVMAPRLAKIGRRQRQKFQAYFM